LTGGPVELGAKHHPETYINYNYKSRHGWIDLEEFLE
jgi:hypothetical protein